MEKLEPNFVLEIKPEDIISAGVNVKSFLGIIEEIPAAERQKLFFGVLLELKTFVFTVLDIYYVVATLEKINGNIEYLRVKPNTKFYLGYVTKYSVLKVFGKILDVAYKNSVRFSIEKYCVLSKLNSVPCEEFQKLNSIMVIGNKKYSKIILSVGCNHEYSFSMV